MRNAGEINSNSFSEVLNDVKKVGIIDAPNWDPCLKEVEIGRPLYRRLLHWGPLLAIAIITQVPI